MIKRDEGTFFSLESAVVQGQQRSCNPPPSPQVGPSTVGESRASPQGLLMSPPGAAEQNWRPCPQVVREGSAQPVWGLARLRLGLAAAWPYPPSGTLAFCPRPIRTRVATELALDYWTVTTHSTGELPVPSARGLGVGAVERDVQTPPRARGRCVSPPGSPQSLCVLCVPRCQ